MSTLNGFPRKSATTTGISRARRPCACSAPSHRELEERRAAEQAALQAAEAERQAKEAALRGKEAALAEIARLKALLERQTKG